eukprot:sb/3469140/
MRCLRYQEQSETRVAFEGCVTLRQSGNEMLLNCSGIVQTKMEGTNELFFTLHGGPVDMLKMFVLGREFGKLRVSQRNTPHGVPQGSLTFFLLQFLKSTFSVNFVVKFVLNDMYGANNELSILLKFLRFLKFFSKTSKTGRGRKLQLQPPPPHSPNGIMTLPCFPSGSTACTKCDYFQYSSPGSDACQPCTVSTATNSRCYYSNGYYENLIRPIGVPADVLSFDSSTSDPFTLEAEIGE